MLSLTRPRKDVAPRSDEGWRLAGLTSALDAAKIGYWIYVQETGALQTSPKLREIYGKAFPATAFVEDLHRLFLGEPEEADADPDEVRRRAAAWRLAWAGEGLFDEAHRIFRRAGAPIWARSIVSMERGAKGEVIRVFGLCVDIDDQKRHEAVYVAAREQMADENQFKTDFLATMSHEIRTPLNGVLGMSQLMARSELDPQQRSYLETIRGSGEAMLSILNDALDLSKIEKGLVELSIAELDLAALARETLASAHGQAVEKGLTTAAQIDPACEGVYRGDAGRIRQILANLVFNALKFTERGSVAVALAPSPAIEGVRLSVVDTGPGVPEAEREAIFERFQQTRAEVAIGGGRGAGLGLAVCSQLTQLMGGALGLESQVGRGSTFWVDLPLERVGGPPSDTVETPDAPPIAPQSPRAHEEDDRVRILVAEDDPTNQKVFLGALEPTGYDVVIAKDGVEALERLEAERFNLVLMDLNMPRMSGDEAIVQIRASEASWRNLPIIVVTAWTSRDARRRYVDMGANDYLAKPIEVDRLLKKMESLLSAHAAA